MIGVNDQHNKPTEQRQQNKQKQIIQMKNQEWNARKEKQHTRLELHGPSCQKG